ncbi:sugar ABC transporter substrate-binding protein [Brachybacterium saurashtrense]|uniref:Maltose ABC transporter substrate-binding protein n=1 Tax=Brachybacterium saurashtrense TaxID=556288 RepID=A0A345YLG7_9MICO|nr:maltose ABC transporter substrate-binding protein [Brachybacterium saurashtrense]AXK44769.1 maltose ABC transporter substrate-binding protein [Brachybacterium saurashtrense]RRR23381.1 maltose ABC transporter substrate-binding protein [Brachybacterium saurashtrense]
MNIRRKSFLALGGVAASMTVLAACGGGSDTSDGASGGSSDAGGDAGSGGSSGQLVIWADEEKAPALEPSAKAWGEQNGIDVVVEVVPGDELQANFITANQAGNGPDVTMGAHDWIGNLVQNGAISPVQLPADVADTIAPIGLEAVTYDGQTYGVPYAVETLALYANHALTDTPEPSSLEELISAAEAGDAENVLSLPVGESGDPYHMQPLYTSAGGYLFGRDAEGNLDPSDLGVGQEGSLTAADKIAELGEQGVLKNSITGDNSISLFTEGKSAYLISGPWALADVRDSGIEFTISPIPGFEGMEPAAPFAGVNSFYVASNGANAGFAQQFMTDVAGSPDVAKAMYEANPLPPVNLQLREEIAASDEHVTIFAEAAESADPMPAIPAMAAIWGPLGIAQANIVGGADPHPTMEAAGEEIATAIG